MSIEETTSYILTYLVWRDSGIEPREIDKVAYNECVYVYHIHGFIFHFAFTYLLNIEITTFNPWSGFFTYGRSKCRQIVNCLDYHTVLLVVKWGEFVFYAIRQPYHVIQCIWRTVYTARRNKLFLGGNQQPYVINWQLPLMGFEPEPQQIT